MPLTRFQDLLLTLQEWSYAPFEGIGIAYINNQNPNWLITAACDYPQRDFGRKVPQEILRTRRLHARLAIRFLERKPSLLLRVPWLRKYRERSGQYQR